MADGEELMPVPLSPASRNILLVVVAHAQATSPTEHPEDGHNDFTPHFDDPQGQAMECLVCHKRLPLGRT